MNGNPLRTLGLIEKQAKMAERYAPRLRSSIESHWYPSEPPEDLRDALDALDVHLASIRTMCSRYEPYTEEGA